MICLRTKYTNLEETHKPGPRINRLGYESNCSFFFPFGFINKVLLGCAYTHQRPLFAVLFLDAFVPQQQSWGVFLFVFLIHFLILYRDSVLIFILILVNSLCLNSQRTQMSMEGQMGKMYPTHSFTYCRYSRLARLFWTDPLHSFCLFTFHRDRWRTCWECDTRK